MTNPLKIKCGGDLYLVFFRPDESVARVVMYTSERNTIGNEIEYADLDIRVKVAIENYMLEITPDEYEP